MKYRKDEPSQDFAKALYLEKSQVSRIDNAIQKACDSIRGSDFSMDELNAFVAPYIKTQEEAYYAATMISVTITSMEKGVLKL